MQCFTKLSPVASAPASLFLACYARRQRFILSPGAYVIRAVGVSVLVAAVAIAGGRVVSAQSAATADVVVVVDTSTSMQERGMDPERASLLVTRLLADLVPGHLAVVRLLDVTDDRALIPSRNTGRQMPCSEDPSRTCTAVDAEGDWEKSARQGKYGTLVRAARRDASFKRELDGHLAQQVNNSMFSLAFRAAQGVFDDRAGGSIPRTVLWLSDGRSDGEGAVLQVLSELRSAGVQVEPFVFGRGDQRLATQAQLSPRRVSSPAEMMKAFAGVFRRIVGAPYELDGLVSGEPTFEMKPQIDEVWIVVYGDDSLSEASVDGPAGTLRADYASDRHAGAGAYRVVHVTRPAAGNWVVKAVGGGAGTAYAVVQRSGITPRYLGPTTAFANAPVFLRAQLQGSDGQAIQASQLPTGLVLDVRIDGQWVPMADDGAHGDGAASDGEFGATARFAKVGDVPIVVRARNDVIDRSIDAVVKVTGFFRYRGGPVELDFGPLPHTGESCRTLVLDAEHLGGVPFELIALLPLPAGHSIEIRTPQGVLSSGGAAVVVTQGEAFTACLVTDAAVSSAATGEPWAELRPSSNTEAGVAIRMRWQVEGMTFWQRWGWLILLVLVLVVLVFIVYGFIKPYRFTRGLALAFVADLEDLDMSPRSLAAIRGVRIGWYRDARAFLHPSFQVSGEARGALAGLRATSAGTWATGLNGNVLHRETVDGDWEQVADKGRSARLGELYRVGEQGPYFRLSARAR